MKKVSSKLIFLLISSSLAPLLLFGIISIWSSRSTAYKSISEGNLNVALRAAEQIDLYVTNSIRILNAIAQNINRTHLQDWQKETIIRNYVNNFAEFESIWITDKTGRVMLTSELDGTKIPLHPPFSKGDSKSPPFSKGDSKSPPLLKGDSKSSPPLLKGDSKSPPLLKGGEGGFGEIYKSEVSISDNLVPFMTIAVPIILLNEFEGMIGGEINLTNMWRLVDSIRIGKSGFAFVASKSGLLIAHGDSGSKVRVIQEENIKDMEIVKSVLKGESAIFRYKDYGGIEMLGVSAPIKSLGWGLIIEQPVSEAYAPAVRLSYGLMAMVVLFLIVMAFIGYAGGRRYIIMPITNLIQGTKQVAQGIFDKKVEVNTNDEFSELGSSFNSMSEKLVELQDDIRKKEREATLGKIAAGIVHDLRHPLKNIENNSRLIQREYADEDYRQTFKKIVEREFANIEGFFGDLLELGSPKPLQLVPLNPDSLINSVIDSISLEAKNNRVDIVREYHPFSPPYEGGETGEVKISADKFALERVFKNVIINAIQAMPDGGALTISTKIRRPIHWMGAPPPLLKGETNPPFEKGGQGGIFLEISFQDTGTGIPPDMIKTVFDDYKSTKRKGLGLGLAISKKIIEQHKGIIEAESTPGKGTTFIIKLPLTKNKE
jgi:signal transduction histidine kinase